MLDESTFRPVLERPGGPVPVENRGMRLRPSTGSEGEVLAMASKVERRSMF